MAGLTAARVKAEARVGFHRDSVTPGLYLKVTTGGTKSFVYRFQLAGRPRWMGLGSVEDITLAEARERARDARGARLAGVDPIDARRASVAAGRASVGRTFHAVAEEYIESHRAGWRNPKHAAQWPATLKAYAYPAFGGVSVAAVDTGMVTQVLKPLWSTKTETATRLRGRIEAVIDYALAHGWRTAPNPARWRGHLDAILPTPGKVRRVRHHAALPYRELPQFITALGEQPGVGARALAFAILTAGRTGEVLGARWREFNMAERLWTIPGERMKAGRAHRVPLSDAALALLGMPGKPDAFVFPGRKPGAPLSNMTLLVTLRRMGRPDLTTHGFRSTFSDWCAERTAFPSEVRKMALAHAVADKVEAAYRRGDLFRKRHQLMEAWAKFCATRPRSAEDSLVLTRR